MTNNTFKDIVLNPLIIMQYLIPICFTITFVMTIISIFFAGILQKFKISKAQGYALYNVILANEILLLIFPFLLNLQLPETFIFKIMQLSAHIIFIVFLAIIFFFYMPSLDENEKKYFSLSAIFLLGLIIVFYLYLALTGTSITVNSIFAHIKTIMSGN